MRVIKRSKAKRTRVNRDGTISCQYCGRTIHPYRDPEPEDEAICGICEDQREDARRDAYYEAQGDLQRDGDDAAW